MPFEEGDLPAPPRKHEGLIKFGRDQRQQQGPDMSGVNADINMLSRRLRLLEEGFTNLRRFFQVTEENIISKNKHFNSEIKTFNSDLTEMRKEISNLKDKLLLIIKELQSVARRDEVKVLEKYINLWNPVRFVTQTEIEGIINEVIEKREKEDKQNR